MSININGPADLAAYLPYSFGYIPREKVGILVENGGTQETLTTNLPPEDSDLGTQWAAELLTLLVDRNRPTERIILVVYTEDEEEYPRREALTTFAMSSAIMLGTPVEGYVVGRGRWESYTDDQHGTISDIENSHVHAAMIAQGKPTPMEYAPPTLPEPLDDVDEEALDDLTFERLNEFRGVYAWSVSDPRLRTARALWRKALERDFGPTKQEAYDLISYFSVTNVAARLMVDTVCLSDDKDTIRDVLSGRAVIEVHREAITRALELVDNLFQHAVGHHRHTLLTVKTWLHWYRGDQMDAEALAEVLGKSGHVSPLAYLVIKAAVSAHKPPMGTIVNHG